ncbi:hypothetical protein PCANC_24248 [Puccinia coronata f. sp. avenae]|uniref:Uncharacterized protein n=1 Tax=Puccinia coronata f. sp. avenae TaxID=200324 RepID=A0A2N5TFZ8_9BASI|nr:hypothetical protein PCANC_28716 [Puccinia coronata f. sp. avenae]PLW25660.1 hypothetical protein PCANC_24248 [Puccinia coronata f. sp. avenae]
MEILESTGGCAATWKLVPPTDHLPHPPPIKALLYSEKKPGDLTTRQVLVEIIQEVSSWTSSLGRGQWMEPLASAHLLLRKLIVSPPNPKKANSVDFVAVTHCTRPFKTFVNEFIRIIICYIWVFFHAANQF